MAFMEMEVTVIESWCDFMKTQVLFKADDCVHYVNEMARYIDTDIQSIKAGKCHDVKVKQDAVDDHNVAKAKFDKAAKKSMDNAANRTKFIGENIASLKNLEREVTLKIQKQKMIDAEEEYQQKELVRWDTEYTALVDKQQDIFMKTLTKINEMTITLGDLVKALAGDMITNADCLTGKKDCFEEKLEQACNKLSATLLPRKIMRPDQNFHNPLRRTDSTSSSHSNLSRRLSTVTISSAGDIAGEGPPAPPPPPPPPQPPAAKDKNGEPIITGQDYRLAYNFDAAQYGPGYINVSQDTTVTVIGYMDNSTSWVKVQGREFTIFTVLYHS